MRYDYGIAERGDSPDYYNLVLPLQRLFPNTQHYDFLARYRAVGRVAMNHEFKDLVRRNRPDVTLVVLYGHEFEPATIEEARRWTTTVAYFWDDSWRRAYATAWARHFDLVTTADPDGVSRFARAGCFNAIYSPLCFNADIFVRQPEPFEHDVSFVGMYHPYRHWMIGRVQKAGFRVTTFGHRWPGGRLPLRAMIRLFNRSRINLNLSNSTHWDMGFILSNPLAVPWNLKLGKHREQVKTRHFEIAACGGFQLSYEVDYLAGFFAPGREIGTYADPQDLVDKVAYYLDHDDERSSVGLRGWQRAQAEHSAARRYRDLLAEVKRRVAAASGASIGSLKDAADPSGEGTP